MVTYISKMPKERVGGEKTQKQKNFDVRTIYSEYFEYGYKVFAD